MGETRDDRLLLGATANILGFRHGAKGAVLFGLDFLLGGVEPRPGSLQRLQLGQLGLLCLGLGTLFRFWSYRKWVFPEVPEKVVADEAMV